MPELELPVGAKVLVSPAGRDLVVAVEPADHEGLLEELRRLGEREELAGLQTHGHEEIARAFRGAECHRRCPDVDEPLLLHRIADGGDRRRGETQVALHAVAPQVEVAVAKACRLLDSLVVELERQRLRTGDDLELADLDLDFASGNVRIDGLGRAANHVTARMYDELGADVVCDLCSFRRMVGVDDQLDDAGVIAQVDEDQSAVIAAARDPAGDRDRLCDTLGADLAAVEIAPPIHPVILSTIWSSGALKSSRPCCRTVAWTPATMTVQPAPSRVA